MMTFSDGNYIHSLIHSGTLANNKVWTAEYSAQGEREALNHNNVPVYLPPQHDKSLAGDE